ncbi:MAG: antibiotic ABC transporter ATP-binding protein [Flavobacteriales bacterium]|nr:MAG: antibiotic ABC transporter ATP-binding protein [Flavobacteriales bacterium]
MSNSVTGKAFDLVIFSRILSYVRVYKFQFIMSLFAVLALALLSGGVRPLLLKHIVNDYIINKDAEKLLLFVLIMLGVLLTEVILQFIFIFFANWLGQNVIKDMRTRLFKRILKFRTKYFNTTPVGKLVTRVVSDIETIASVFGQGLFIIVSDLLKMVILLAVMFYTDWQLTLIVLAILPVLIYATKIFQIKIKISFQDIRNQVANLNSFVQERISGMKIVQLFSRENIEYDKFERINEKHKNAYVKTIFYYAVFFPIIDILSAVTLGLIVWYGGLKAANANNPEMLGVITMFLTTAQALFRPLRQIADKFNTLQMGIVAADRVFTVMDVKEDEPDTGTLVAPHFKGNIEFKDVYFSYLPDEPVLKGISFEAKPGETIAVVGATGAGKSTLINLLSRFYPIKKGAISIDGTNISEFTLSSLRNEISLVLQDVFLFSDTIFNNITLHNNDITIDEVKEAAQLIGIHNFIMSLPGNYEYNVKERGGMLSSGQRQLIAFLRAYVSKPAILVLDEATSSIDAHSEKLIQKATKIITKNRTSIVIAHRLATIKSADKIIVMDRGKIVEKGTHAELLKKGGYYSKLYEIQFETAKAS